MKKGTLATPPKKIKFSFLQKEKKAFLVLSIPKNKKRAFSSVAFNHKKTMSSEKSKKTAVPPFFQNNDYFSAKTNEGLKREEQTNHSEHCQMIICNYNKEL